MRIKQVTENDMDLLLDEIERIRELHVKVGSNDEPISERWLRAAILQNLPAKVVQDLAIDLKKGRLSRRNVQYSQYIHIRPPYRITKRPIQYNVVPNGRQTRRQSPRRQQ